MKCGKVRDLFSRYLENATDGRITARVEEHLSACESCRRAYQRFRATVAMLDSIPEVEPPADFHATVMAQVERAKRAAPAPVRWWTVDWQHVFTIRVPVRAAAVGIAAILLFVLAFQLFPPLRTGIASLLLPQKPAPAPISSIDDNAVRTPLPWSPKTSGPGLQISVEPEKPGTYSVRLGTTSKKQVAFEVEVDGTKYSGSLAAGAGSQIKVPAPSAGSVAVVHIAWSIGEWGRYQSLFLPAKLNRRSLLRSFMLENVTVRDVLRVVCREYGVAIIASGDLGKNVGYVGAQRATPEEVLYDALSPVGLKATGVAASVYQVEPVR